ncbi:MAG: acyltransferase [Nitrospirae bacterium]|nr:acyltransferase [Nitrospirota bacterium]
MKAGCYQFDPAFGEKEENLNRVASALKNADLNLLVLPEFFATGYQFRSKDEVAELSESVKSGQTTEFLCGMSREKGIYIVAGLPERDGDKFYNSAILTGPDGLMGVYRKTHLYFEEKLYFSPGDTGFKVWDTEIGRIGIMICFDWFFPEAMRCLALNGAEIVAHPSNLVLPHCPGAMPLRCLENRVYAITANRIGTEDRTEGKPLKFIGQSLIVSPRGEVLANAPAEEETLLIAELDLKSARDKTLNPLNDIFKDRMPEAYEAILKKER